MNTPLQYCGFESRRIVYTREQIEFLSEIKKLNDGRISAVLAVAESEPMFDSFSAVDIARFAEDCDKMLADWDKPNGQFVVMGNPS